jgi:hypothetical protein
VVAKGDGALASGCPDPARDRLQPDPVLVRGEDLDRRVGVLGGFFGDDLRKLF